MSAVCIIPARGGSTRIPRKNIRMFHGKPIIAYSVEAAKASGLFQKIVVSSDDKEILDIGMQYGATTSHFRGKDMSLNEVGTQEVARHVLKFMNDIEEFMVVGAPGFETVCCIYPTAPLMRQQDLYDGYCELKDNAADFAFSVGTNPLRDAGQFYWGTARAFLSNRPLISPESIMIPIPETNVCDINVEYDWIRCEQMYLSLKEKQ